MTPRTALISLTAAAAAAAAVAVALGACSSPATPAAGQTPGVAASSSTPSALAGRAGDVMFAQMMIPHHEQAIEMADIALGKPSASAKVRELATAIKAAQDPEIAQMTAMLKSWGASTTGAHGMDHGMGSGGMMSGADLSALKTAQGADFDRRWLTGMIAHHEGAVMMANQVRSTTTDPSVKALADAIVNSQTGEITTMQALL